MNDVADRVILDQISDMIVDVATPNIPTVLSRPPTTVATAAENGDTGEGVELKPPIDPTSLIGDEQKTEIPVGSSLPSLLSAPLHIHADHTTHGTVIDDVDKATSDCTASATGALPEGEEDSHLHGGEGGGSKRGDKDSEHLAESGTRQRIAEGEGQR